VVIPEITSQDVTQVALAEDDDVVETLAPNRADQAFGEGILPRASGGRETSRMCIPFTRWRNASP
jgi:hypothetical protein